MSKINDTVTRLATPVLTGLGLELWDVEFTKEAGYYYLRLYIDSPNGVGLDDCEKVSRAVDPLLDEYENLFPDEGYTFEVSSAGLERRLYRPSDFERFTGSFVEVKLYSPKFDSREHTGTLKSYDNGTVTITVGDEEREFTKAEVANVRLRIQ